MVFSILSYVRLKNIFVRLKKELIKNYSETVTNIEWDVAIRNYLSALEEVSN